MNDVVYVYLITETTTSICVIHLGLFCYFHSLTIFPHPLPTTYTFSIQIVSE